jgi:hypothetical protein
MFWLDELICVAQMPNLMSLSFWVMVRILPFNWVYNVLIMLVVGDLRTHLFQKIIHFQ